MKRFFLALGGSVLCILALFALIYFGAKWDTEAKIQQAKERSAAAEARAGQVAEAIKSRQLIVGMTPEDAVKSWGEPKRKNVTGGEGGSREQWVYDGTYVYFKNGRLVSWSQSR